MSRLGCNKSFITNNHATSRDEKEEEELLLISLSLYESISICSCDHYNNNREINVISHSWLNLSPPLLLLLSHEGVSWWWSCGSN